MEALTQKLLTYETLPKVIDNVEQLEDVLSTPTAALVEDLAKLEAAELALVG
ncbi:MAG: hypothetical protein IIB63_00665 [Proteobacteria bacterium]|nr:hypothetical protein [Pseudomonadota bacterium]